MKLPRPLLITLAVGAGLAVTVLGLGLTPAVQRWAFLQTVGKQSGMHVEVAEVAADFNSVKLAGLVLQQPGLRVSLTQLEADYSLFALLWHRRLEIRQLAASGLLVDASRLSRARTQAASAAAPLAAPGLLGRLQLPIELMVEDVRLEGRALLPGTPSIQAEYRITGGNFAPGQEGALQLHATMKDPAQNAAVAGLHAQLSLRATQTNQKDFSRVSLTAVVDATGRTISGATQLKLAADLDKDAAGESYTLSVDTLLVGKAENVLAGQAKLPAGSQEFAGQWSLKARTAQLQPFFLGGDLPEFRALGEGRFVFSPSTAAVSLQGQLTGEASRLETLAPSLRPLGAVKCSAQFDVAVTSEMARLQQLEVRLEGDKPVLELHAANPAEWNFKTKRMQVGPNGNGEVLDLQITGLPLAWVRQYVSGVDISGDLITGRLTVRAEPDRLLARTRQPLRVGSMSIVQRGQLLLSKADLSLQAEAGLTAEALTITIDEFSGRTSQGDAVVASAQILYPLVPASAVTLAAKYSADLPQLLAPWLPLGRVKAAGEFDLTQAGNQITVRHLVSNVTDVRDAALVRVRALRPFTLDVTARRALIEPTGAADLLQITLGRLPLERLPLNRPGLRLGGWVERGDFTLATEGDKLTLRSDGPLSLSEITYTQNEQPVLSGLRVEAFPTIELSGQNFFKAETGAVVIRTASGGTLLAVAGELTRTAGTDLRGALTFKVEVPALATQPFFSGTQPMVAGQGSGEIRCSLGEASQLEARLTINGLVAPASGQILPVANLSLRAVAQRNGQVSIQAPLLLDRGGQRSDLNVSVELSPAGEGYRVEGQLTGEQVELGDVVTLLSLFSAPPVPGDGTTAQNVGAGGEVIDVAPAWSPFTGSLALNVKSVTQGTDWAMTGLTGLVKIEPTRLALEKLEAAFDEKSRFAAQATVLYRGGARPYALSGDFALNEFDAGKFFKALEPTKPATLEGLFNAQGKFAGEGTTLTRLMERTQGSFALTSPQGVFRGLQRTSNRVSLSSKAVELGATVLGSLFGSQKVTRAAEKIAGSAYFVDQLAQSVGELNYDQFSVKLVRDAALNVKLEDISLVSPEIRLVGQGTVVYQPDKPLLEQPLNATLSIAARGKLEQLLGKLRLLDGNRDELGYAKTSQPVILGGSLAKPDPTAYFARIASAKLSELLAPEN